MLNILKNFFKKTEVEESPEVFDRELGLSLASLLIEISRSDNEVDQNELEVIAKAILQVTTLTAHEVNGLIKDADKNVTDSISLYDFTSVINEKLSREERYQLLVLLWKVAYADGRVDKYEEHYVRKISDLLYLDQSDFIRAKHEARQKVIL
jgi:uncharacterized tellurite resistance protein B-like protein